jgi:hypothetical protein
MMKAMLASSSKTWLEEVQADSPIALWLMQEASGTTMTATVGPAGAYSASGITYQAAGPGKAALPAAAQFSGTKSGASALVNLSTLAPRLLTVCWWMYWNTFANNDALAMEYTSNAGLGTSRGFYINPNSGVPLNGTMALMNSDGDGVGFPGRTEGFARPSAAAWHHYAATFDRNTPDVGLYIDGIAITPSPVLTSAWTASDFAYDRLYFMCRNLSNLRAAGRMAGVSLHPSILSAARIAAHFAGA